MACELVVTRSVRDTTAILDLLAGPEPGDLDALERPAAPYAAGDPGRLRVGVLGRVLRCISESCSNREEQR